MTPEQAALIVKARESIRAAQLLVDHDLHDTAVSRAYYAMFYLAQALLLSHRLSFSKHSGVISAFGQYLVKPGLVPAHFHRYLIDAQARRLASDYSTMSGIGRDEAQQQIEHAREFLTMTEEVLAPEPTSRES